MAVRLTVVMIQTPPPSPAAAQLTEGVIGELIGRPGIDMTLIGTLAQLGEGSVDRLTIESLSGDVAVLDWQSPEAIVESCRAAGVPGQRWPHPGDPEAPQPADPQRRIYAFDLNGFESAEAVCAAVHMLLASRQTRTFTLGGLPGSSGLPRTAGALSGPSSPELADGTGGDARRRGQEPGRAGSLSQRVGAADDRPAGPASNAAPARAENPARGDSAAAGRDGPGKKPGAAVDLDRLVDQLDELDP